MNRSLTVLLVEDNPDFAQLVQRWLVTSQGVAEFDVIWKQNLAAGLQRLEQGGLDVVLLDLGLPDSNGFETLFRVKPHTGGTPIIVLSADDDESLALRMVQEGAQDYLVKSTCSGDYLAKSIRYAVVRNSGRQAVAQPTALAKMIGVVGAKGGVGATTFACNLAAELRGLTGQKTLLADLDINTGLVAFLCNTKPTHSVLDAIANADHLDWSCWNGIVSRGPEDVDILPSPGLFDEEPPDPDQLRQILSGVRAFYGWIVLDLGRTATFSARLMAHLEDVYLVTTGQIPALYEAKRTVDHLKRLGYPLERLHLVVNQCGTATLGKGDLDSIFGVPVNLKLADAGKELEAAYTAGKLPDRKGAYRTQLAGLVRKIANLPEQPKRKTSLFGRQPSGSKQEERAPVR